jgi:alpha-2-macroglobulin
MSANLSFFKNTKNLIILLLFVLAIAAITQRYKKRKHTRENNYEVYSAYVESYTTGIVSRHNNIQVKLATDVQTLHTKNEPIEDGIINISPETEGKAYWLNARTIEFRPAKSFDANQVYTARVNLGKIIEIPEKLSDFVFDFETIKPDFHIDFAGLKSSSNSSADKMQLSGSITTADAEETAQVEKMVQVDYSDKVKVAWEHNVDSRTHRFTIENIDRYKTEKQLKVAYDGEPIKVSGKETESVEVPALDDFKVIGLRVIQDKEQYVLVQFSDPIRIGQELTGLIGISNTEMPAYSIDGSEVKLYPSARLDGNYQVFVNEGIENFNGKKLPLSFNGNINFENTEPSVSIPGKGVILPHSGKLMMPFEAVNLNAVDVSIIKIYGNNIPQYLQQNNMNGESQLRQVAKPVKQITIRLDNDKSVNLHKKARFMLDIDKLIRTEPGAIYRITIGYRPTYSVYTCKGDEGNTTADEEGYDEYDDDQSGGMDEDDEFWKRYDNYYPFGYNWNERNNPCSSSYYNKERWASRNVLASNIGLIAKQGNSNNLIVATTNILSAEPMEGVDLELLDYQQQVIGKTVSGSDGLAQIELKRKPYLLVARHGTERGYLKLDDAGSLPLSRFDVGGNQVQKGLKGFIYGERGVWRPGDSLFLTFILDDKQNRLPKGHPVDFEMYTPQGQLFKGATQTNAIRGFYTFKTSTDPSSPTGNWMVKVKAGGATFEKRIKIETIMPNRLKINLSFGGRKQLTKGAESAGSLRAEWLFGGAARNLNAKIDAFVSSETTSFPKFLQYTFDDPVRPFDSQLQQVFEGKLNEDGMVAVQPDINVEQQAPGRLNANFLVKVFEPGGNFSINQVSMPYHVYNGYVGLKIPEGSANSGMLVTDVNHPVDIVTVDVNGNLRSGTHNVEVELYKMKWQWWWDEEENSVSNFTQDEYNTLMSTATVSLVNGKGRWNLRVNQPNWGRFLLRVRDPNTGHTTGKIVYIDWPNWTERLQNENSTEAAMLSFTSNKQKYRVGETVNLTIPTGSAGRGLVSVENGSRVLKTFWFEAKKGQTRFNFKVDESMTPNVFVNVTLLQPHSQTVNDLPIRMYGVIPIEVEDPETILKPLISMPDEIKPETQTSVTVSEASGKPMTYTIAIVDEGLLDITNFKTPDPHVSFYAREGLGVKTWDMFDYVIGAYGGDLQRILSIGGDRNSGKGGKNPSANRFKPVVKYLGPFTSNGSKKTHTFKLPQYVGSVKVMVIAGENGAYGFAEKAVKVKKPLMIMATMPRVLSPGEQLKLPVTVFAMDQSVKNVSIEVQSNAFTYPVGNRRNIVFTKTGEQLVFLDLVTKNFSGIAKVKVIAKSGKESAVSDVELDVRNPSPVITKVIDRTMEANQRLGIPITAFGTAGTSKITLEVSSIPAMNLEKRLNYLIQYPHGCVEQITSAAFPQLFLGNMVDLSPSRKAITERNIKAAINRLNGFQLPDGGMGYWPGASEADEWGTNYAGHFFVEAEARGYLLPPGFLNQWKKYQKAKAVSWAPSTSDFYQSDLTQAYRLYLLALTKSPEIGAMNRLREFKYLAPAAKWRLAAAYRLAGQPDAAVQLIKGLPLQIKPYRQSFGSYGSDVRDEAMILETVTLLGYKKAADGLVRELAAELSQEEWYSTQTTAYALLAISKYCGANSAGTKLRFNYELGKNKASVNRNSHVWQLPVNVNAGKYQLNISNTAGSRLFVRVIMQGKPAIGDEVSAEENRSVLTMRVGYFSMKGELINPVKITQGTDFMAQVNVYNPGKRGKYHNLALSQLFPSGWEILNTRLMTDGEAFKSSPADYLDIRDDRVNTYFSLEPNKEATYFVLLNASYTGRFYLPPSRCEAMYDGSISASSEGKWVEVISPSASILTAK